MFEDEHLLVVNKPAGLNTHAPSPYAGEGLYDWLRHRERRWASLAIIHRLDKETSGVLVFARSPLANRSLTRQFTARGIRKKYVLVTDRPVAKTEWVVRSSLVRAGEKYVSRRLAPGEPVAETRFRLLDPTARPDVFTPALGSVPGRVETGRRLAVLEAEPLTGRTHQIRVHAADEGFPLLGDTLYGGTRAERVYLHAAEITLRHPATDEEVTFRVPADFGGNARLRLRTSLIEPEATDAYRLIQGASDGWPGWYVDRLGDYLLSAGETSLGAAPSQALEELVRTCSARGAYHKRLSRQVRRASLEEASPQLVSGAAAPERFTIRENGVRFELSFAEGYSVGLFLDQRDNRRRLLAGHVAAGFDLFAGAPRHVDGVESVPAPARGPADGSRGDDRGGPAAAAPTVLNAFAYTCGFSVCAARAGARTTSVDLSRKYLEWGKRNFALNQLDPAQHDFLYGDVFDWLRRFAKRGRSFDVVLLDPPTFSQSKASGVFRAERDYGRLVKATLAVLRRGGVLFVSTNAADWGAESFVTLIRGAIQEAGRDTVQAHFVPQPPDFPVSRTEPAYLKTLWLRVA